MRKRKQVVGEIARPRKKPRTHVPKWTRRMVEWLPDLADILVNEISPLLLIETTTVNDTSWLRLARTCKLLLAKMVPRAVSLLLCPETMCKAMPHHETMNTLVRHVFVQGNDCTALIRHRVYEHAIDMEFVLIKSMLDLPEEEREEALDRYVSLTVCLPRYRLRAETVERVYDMGHHAFARRLCTLIDRDDVHQVLVKLVKVAMQTTHRLTTRLKDLVTYFTLGNHADTIYEEELFGLLCAKDRTVDEDALHDWLMLHVVVIGSMSEYNPLRCVMDMDRIEYVLGIYWTRLDVHRRRFVGNMIRYTHHERASGGSGWQTFLWSPTPFGPKALMCMYTDSRQTNHYASLALCKMAEDKWLRRLVDTPEARQDTRARFDGLRAIDVHITTDMFVRAGWTSEPLILAHWDEAIGLPRPPNLTTVVDLTTLFREAGIEEPTPDRLAILLNGLSLFTNGTNRNPFDQAT